MHALAFFGDQTYWQGRRGQLYTGGDYSEYQRGQRDGGYGGGGGGGLGALVVVLVLLFVIFIALMIVAWAAVTSVFTALLIMAAMKLWPGADEVTFGRAFRTAFFSVLALIAITAALTWAASFMVQNDVGTTLLQGMVELQRAADAGWAEAVRGGHEPSISLVIGSYSNAVMVHAGLFWKFLLALCTPGLLLCGFIFSHRHAPPFGGLRGYVKAVVTAALTILPGLVVSNYVLVHLAERAQVAMLEGELLGAAAWVSALAVLTYALLGGLLAAIAMHLLLKVLARGSAPSLGRTYGTAFLGLLVYGICTAAALYLFRQGDDLLRVMFAAALSDDPSGMLAANAGALGAALWKFLPLQVPGVLFAAGIMSVRSGRVFSGMFGYARACVVGGVLALVLLLPFLGLALFVMSDKMRAMGMMFPQ